MSRYELCKFCPAPDPELICGICMNVLDTPYETLCRHVFCWDCIWTALRENSKCPVCRAPCKEDQLKEVLPLVQNLINKLTMKCDNYDNGCTDLILKEFFLDHVKSCEFVTVQCRYTKCGKSLLKRDCEEHETNICVYRDFSCGDGCGLMIPQENLESHNCKEALLILVKDLKEKNLELQKKIDELNKQALVPVHDNQEDQNSSIIMDDDSFSFSSNTFSSYELSETEMTDLEDESYRTGQRRSRRLATLSQGCESTPDVELSDNSNQSHNSQTSRNYDNYSDDANAYTISDDTGTIDGDNSVGTPEYQVAEDIVNCVENSHNESYFDSNAVTFEGCSQTSDNGTNSPFVHGCSDNSESLKTNTDHARPEKRQFEESCGESSDCSGVKKIKQTRQSSSFEYNDIQSNETAFVSESSYESNISNTKQPPEVRKHTHGHKKKKPESRLGADSQIPSNSGSSSSVKDETVNTSDQTSGTKTTQSNPTSELSSSDLSLNNVSTDGRDEHNLSASRRGPLTRSQGHDQDNLLENNIIPYVKVPPSMAYLLNKYAQMDDSSDDESWSPSHEK